MSPNSAARAAASLAEAGRGATSAHGRRPRLRLPRPVNGRPHPSASTPPPPRRRRHRALLPAVAPAVLCLLALTGCGGGGKAAPHVASLPSTAAATAPGVPGSSASGSPGGPGTPDSSATPAGTGKTSSARPQERLDDTPAEREAMIHAWDECLVAHGAHWTTTRAGVAGAPKTVADPVPKQAGAACEAKLPQESPELNPALNPHYRDDTLAEIACLRAHGVMVHLVPDTSVDPGGLGWTYDSSTTQVPANEGQIEDQCQRQAFGGGKGK